MATKIIERKIVNRHFLLLVPDDSVPIGLRVEEVVIEFRDQSGLEASNEIAAKRKLKSEGRTNVEFLDEIKAIFSRDVLVGTEEVEVEFIEDEPSRVRIVE